MTGLPAALTPWAGLLSAFPEDLALSLGPWVQRLSLALGPLRLRTNAGRSEPDGYHGLARRGPYERLLSTEWLLASELPEEFTRRAAMGEHAFLELAFLEPAGSRRSVALFDAGPSQLGTPRIAHLAALIVMAQRADRAGAGFAWGFLQHPDVPLLNEVTPASVLRLLHARTALEVREKHVEGWRRELELARAPDDLWLVGSPRLATLTEGLSASAVEVRDVLDPVARQLGVAVRRARAPATLLTLELPAPNACTRLLRDPFAVITTLSRIQDPEPGQPLQLLFSSNGRRLLTRLADGSVASHPVPNSPRAGVGKPRRFSPPRAERVVAVGWEKRMLTLTWREKEGLFLHGLTPNGWEVKLPAGETFVPPAASAPVALLQTLDSKTTARLGFLDGAGTLFSIRPLTSLETRVEARGVVAFAPRSGGRWYVGEPPPGLQPAPSRRCFVEESTLEAKMTALDGDGDLACFHGSGLTAIRTHVDRWQLRGTNTTWEIPRPSVGEVVGVVRSRGIAGLMVLGEDRRTLVLIGQRYRRELATAPAEILQACASPWFGIVAFLTVRGEVEVHSLTHGAAVLRLAPGSSAKGAVDGGTP